MNYEALDRKQCYINNNFNNTDIVINNNRAICCGLSSLEKTTDFYTNNEGYIESLDYSINELSLRKDNLDNDDKTNTNIKIYRYKFTIEFIEELYKFSKIHQYDHRRDFKEAWELWIEEKSNIILEESTRLSNLGYDGDILNKMFTSARYYFRKKGTEKKEPRMRCNYIGLQKELLDAMDNHISLNLHESWFKPSNGFTKFCKENIELLQQEIELLIRYNITDSTEIKKKIKKTYKNRYFMIINKNN
jgi:hypothetical protein